MTTRFFYSGHLTFCDITGMVCYRPDNLGEDQFDPMASLMKKFHCDQLEVIIGFDEKEFKKKDFFKIFPRRPRNSNRLIIHLGSSNPNNGDHVHLELNLQNERSSIRAVFHSYKYKQVDSLPEMTLETCVSWMHSFLNGYDYAEATASFEYGKGYLPAIQFDYPLLVNNPQLKGATVVGHTLNFPLETGISHLFVVKSDEKISALVSGLIVSVEDFDPRKQIEHLSQYAEALVYKSQNNGKKD